ncbi:methylenetetrahydrofolate reductase C-terminal domain-containing protein [Candidatus Villigracilis saccharophilus]|uniref:methylenetetrahydrofolate reductase C-terminal domain-containing protein n=1 Tax=Candidatus Villigracilis saccharophilus TaxID=3140684 RepID=UPI003137118E|nr:methylenetetrahydrofolate reductase C-terminal domain-containing protein [Anaerolineales bacterium]
MSVFTPGRRWQPPFMPFKRTTFKKRALAKIELAIKGPLFGCRMCGNCLLQETAFICPMECPKGLRNGPCGGSTPEKCYVDESRPCIWYKIYERSFKLGREALLLEVLPPMDWEKAGTDSWGDVFSQAKKIGAKQIVTNLTARESGSVSKTLDSIFRPVRQPDWWQGDSLYHAPKYSEPASELERRLKAGEFVVAAEVTPPLSINTEKLKQNIELLKPYVAALNFTDSPSAIPRMSSWACSKFALEQGAEPVMQIAARDRTRVGLQSEVVGAAALGVRNILCITGDSMALSPSPRGRMDIVDIDSVQMLWIMRRMRDEGKYLDGREMKSPPRYFLGAAASPFASNMKFQALREQKKVNAGAQFFQTNVVFDADALDEWLNEIARRGILDKVYIMVGLTPLKNYKTAAYMNSKIPGVFVPEKVLKRMEDAKEKGNEQEEGAQITLELIEKIKTKQGVHGIHIMAVGWEEIVPRIVQDAGLYAPAPAAKAQAG